MDAHIFQKSRSNLHILGVRIVLWSTLHSEYTTVEWPVNHIVIWHFLLGACEPIRVFAWGKKTAKKCAEYTSYHLTPGTWNLCTPGLNYMWDSGKCMQRFNKES